MHRIHSLVSFKYSVGLPRPMARVRPVHFLAITLISAMGWGQGTAQPRHLSAPPRAARPSAPKPADEDDFQQLYDAARTFQISGNQDRAAAEYRKFLVKFLRVSAKANSDLGQQDKAAGLFEDALHLAPDDPDTRLEYAQLRFKQDKFTDARDLAEKALASSPDNPQVHSLLGQILFAQGDYKGAREQLEIAVVGAPGFDIGYLLGITYIKLGEFDRCRLVFDDIVSSFGDTAKIHMMLGRAYKQGGWEVLYISWKVLKIAITMVR